MAALLASGCTRTLIVEGQAPPLVSGLKNIRTVAVGEFTSEEEMQTELAASAAGLLAYYLSYSRHYEVSDTPAEAQLVISGAVSAPAPEGAPDVSVTFTGTAGAAMTLFRVVERSARPQERDPAEDPDDARERTRGLVRSCVKTFVADISPRRVRAKAPRPVLRGQRRTRRGIDRLVKDPTGAVIDLTRAVEQDSEDVFALNALGVCDEIAGNLDLALSSYTCAAAIDPRDAFRENMQRVHALLEHKREIERTSR